MQEGFSLMRVFIVGMTLVALFSGCASTAPAPMETRTPSRPEASGEVAPAVARPGHYIVKKGDTLYSIARLHERDYREIAAWNGLDDPGVIKVGQELRVAPVADAAVVTGAVAVAPATIIESKPITGSSEVASAGPISAPASSATGTPAPVGQKAEPKGGRMAYSPQAWKDLQAVGAVVPAAASVPVAASQPQAAQSKPAESKPAVANDDEPGWSWPGSGKVIATFNDSSNKGIDLAGNIGDPVLAAEKGRVMYVGSGLRGYGKLVIIKHNKNYQSVYAHNSEILVKEEQIVQKGQKIAALGNSDTDQPKLHFEIRRQGKPVDPMKHLPTR
ncbi:peptidoglycan DD-metalloendopeptidase family protein [Uliginosibacterium sp. 31-16]|uniref:peptidoglycan DD-metalloendopeptidase family protein n=1 Tax=Uliginosibacterium sp. 31-16 TaxID=3068315 RepID=UPI00273DF954|nr:peptidoglycan DD-metalloendopeptidase family protein [Uliginosibacterium sp. 31-16]MDP5241287.1 peptidoglycan DD-metalloendopeptidase family protein [Uliginosibacterium sp. 31-16]